MTPEQQQVHDLSYPLVDLWDPFLDVMSLQDLLEYLDLDDEPDWPKDEKGA